MNKFFIPLVLIAIAYAATTLESPLLRGERAEPSGSQRLQQAFERQQSDVHVRGTARVVKILSDDNKGSRHQRFIVETRDGQSLLIAHNIDLAPRVPNLERGDEVEFYGEYEWNDKGGVIHWTHHDPRSQHEHGWLLHEGRKYQ